MFWKANKARKFFFLYVTSRPVASYSARAMQALGFDPAQMQQRGYLLKEPPEARERASTHKHDHAA
jgi:hypothetical protein